MNVSGENGCADRLKAQLLQNYLANCEGGLATLRHRLPVLPVLILQRLGLSFWTRVPTFFGRSAWIYVGESSSGGLLAFSYVELALTALMLEILKPGMRFVDVGSHLGYEAMLGSVLVGETGSVIAFEPQPKIAKWTKRNLVSCKNTRLVVAAVADHAGMVEIESLEIKRSSFASINTSGSGVSQRVPCVTLDSALIESGSPVDLIKCDAEGAEISVLKGAQRILSEDRPLLILEGDMPAAAGGRPRVKEFDSHLLKYGYQRFSFDYDGQLITGSPGSMTEGHANVGYVHPSRSEFSAIALR